MTSDTEAPEDTQNPADGSEPESGIDEKKMSLIEHLTELRRRLMYAAIAFVAVFLVCFYFSDTFFNFLVEPLASVWSGGDRRLIFTALHEKFFTNIKVAFFSAAFLSFPIFAAQIYMFVAPGLYKNEKGAFLPFLIATPFLFFGGGAFVYYIVMPVAWQFFTGFEQLAAGSGGLPIELEPKVNEYLSLVMRLIFAFGISFELPVVLSLLAKVGIVSADGLKKKRRYAIVIAFVAAAVLTPPDPLSQLALAIPIIVLYEISIYCAILIGRRRDRDAAAKADE
ncbi:MAG: twin-arginine translocase subunit TatC [Rhodospirillaceae bacterium]|jgi:sec-independent protein translocase protein TatC|nr:twin-arginine translocase subunit TatC [Rhodospirillaceae bacterium]MBT4771481.1 twin-arginine translocase subunit TatC [Rhodospirillaceae bacterium]MBT5356780.1 twin-arginine translocase subunit TatC [Rhodospirillaceae bacterium]MBT5770737.1 twin-arginine translocase subunit TatC [Rhodospirillaceae bacterium]MBT6311261.1 twin-arginine translocase subunit TatC [Rhodospirillaceae bacterium]